VKPKTFYSPHENALAHAPASTAHRECPEDELKYKLFLVSLIVVLSLSAASVYAHHSLSATYQATAEIKLEGALVQFVFRNPHSFVHMEARKQNGEMERWAIEWTGAAALSRQGVQGNTLKPGDHVVITARPSRSPGETRALMLSLKRPADNFSWGARPGEVVD
jgi:hypothetical protein